jgi:hypothetical protein
MYVDPEDGFTIKEIPHEYKLKCPICGVELEKMGEYEIHKEKRMKIIDERCVFSEKIYENNRWLTILDAFAQAGRLNANAGLPDHLRQ